MKLCIDCRFFGGHLGLGPFCIRDSVLANAELVRGPKKFSPVDGKLLPPDEDRFALNRTAFVERTEGVCGIDAINFEPKKRG